MQDSRRKNSSVENRRLGLGSPPASALWPKRGPIRLLLVPMMQRRIKFNNGEVDIFKVEEVNTQLSSYFGEQHSGFFEKGICSLRTRWQGFTDQTMITSLINLLYIWFWNKLNFIQKAQPHYTTLIKISYRDSANWEWGLRAISDLGSNRVEIMSVGFA